ncbi:uncharacterized protein IUM83_18525 [Phytophthora cinnamomi]|uniref:uncharacterized protein n=1 Tax=Phytophthora cinnamomi TaxID=4785 RepID=UPI003559734E|nr:hypothetical protein IUM83_18525 [Phytophthora cinnamomi]
MDVDDLLRDLTESTLTLEEALELIDTCDVAPGLDSTDLPTCNDFEASQAAVTDVLTKPKKRVRNPLNDVRRRQRRKAERQQLKDQVQEYEALVERLKRCRQTQASDGDSIETRALTQQPTWLHAAIEEERKRRHAERVNAKLKALLVERLQATGVVRDALKKEKMLLSKIESAEKLILPTPSRALKSCLLEADSTFSGLSRALQHVFDTTDTVFRSFPTSSFESLQSISRVKQRDQSSGPCIELLTTTPLACDLQTAKNVLWEVIADKKWPADQNAFDLKAKESSSESMELKFSMGLEQSQLSLDATSASLISSSSVNLQNSILRSMGHRVKSRIESVQQSLVEKAGSPGSSGLIFI